MLRLYVRPGCPHCEEAEKYLRDRLGHFQLVRVSADPIARKGLMAVTQDRVPALVSVTGEGITVVVGHKPHEFDRLIALHIGPGTIPSHPVATEGNGSQPAAELAEQKV